MRVAIYARRSTEEHQAESLEVQIDEARRFAAARGWTITETFAEDAVSRAEFVKRPALISMLNGAREGRFEIVLMRDETRLGGDMHRTGMIIQDLYDRGVRIFHYANGQEVDFNNPTGKLISAITGWASELEREKIASRTRNISKAAPVAERTLEAECSGTTTSRSGKVIAAFASSTRSTTRRLVSWSRFSSNAGPGRESDQSPQN